jgi:prevent-host-death family protein
VDLESSNHKGAVAEAKIAAAAIALGVPVLKPLTEHGRYDLVFEIGGRLWRVQCKWATRKGAILGINVGGNYLSPHGYIRSTYGPEEIDAVAAYSGDLDKCFWLPIDLVAGMNYVHLRLAPPKNAQRAGLNWAAEHTLEGAVAQLGERRLGRAEATGSSPVSSTPRGAFEPVGAHEFRNLFGWYMQRASRGERFEITRRGKPFARLLPPTDQLALVESERVEAA